MPLLVPSGLFAISTLTLEIPVRKPKTFSPNTFRLNGKPVFHLQTVLVTFFYPTSGSNSEKNKSFSGISWLPIPKWKSMEGLCKYAGLSKWYAYPAIFILPYFTRLPYTNNAPLSSDSPHLISIDNEAASQTTQVPASATPFSNQFPVGIFSHGLAGSRTTYSQYLAELASQGMIIASVEHRDGSGPSTMIRHENGMEETLTYFKYDELDAGKETMENTSIWEMRKAQLELRQSEVLEVVDILKQLNDGKGEALAASSTRSVDSQSKLSDWKGRLDLRNLWALGHSFGGATCIELIRKPDSIFTHAMVLDPWLEAIPKAGEGKEKIKKPLYVINSEAFTIWKSHFYQVKDLVQESFDKSGSAWLMTITKTVHTDFSDFPLLMPRFFKNKSGIPPSSLVKLFSQVSQMQFIGKFDRNRLDLPVRDEIEGEIDRRDLGKGGEAIWHSLLPSSRL